MESLWLNGSLMELRSLFERMAVHGEHCVDRTGSRPILGGACPGF